jgi:cysteine desulfurase/selenocysteine lyase
VIEAVRSYYETIGAVIKRGAHKLSIEATDQYEKARVKVAQFFNVAPAEIAFVPNESYGISSLVYGLPWVKKNRIITSVLEHHSNFLPILYLASRFGVEIDYLNHNKYGELLLDSVTSKFTTDTKLVSLTYSPLLFGTVSPIPDLVKIAHDHNVPVLVDGTRIAGHLPIDLKALGCDFFVCHGNVGLLGPMGLGVLYIKQDAFIQLNPSIIGSGTVSKVKLSGYQLMDPPSIFEPGNPNVAGVVGLGAAVDYLMAIGLKKIRSYEKGLIETMVTGLSNIENVKLYGPTDPEAKNGIVSFNIDELNAHDSAMYLDEAGRIAVRSGQLCSHPMMDAFELSGAVQASLHLYNSKEEIIQFLEIVQTIATELA